MYVKLLGSLLIALSGGALSVSFCRFEKKRLFILDSYVSLLFYIKGQIDCYSRPLSDILAEADMSLIEACGYRGGIPKSISDMLPHVKIYLESESLRLLLAFADEFGSTYKQEQLRRCDYYIEALLERRRLLCDEIPSRSRVGSALWMCASFALMIILW